MSAPREEHRQDLRAGLVRFQGRLAGRLEETPEGFRFTYEPDYIASGAPPIGFHFPLSERPFHFDRLPAFFDNLVAEGWLRRVQSQTQRIAEEDRFGLLLLNGRDLVGAVTVEPEGSRDDE